METKIESAEAPEVTELRADARYMANLIEKLRLTVETVTDEMQDEGGRVYFGSTNQADQLKDLADDMEGLAFERIMRGKKQPDLYADLRALRADQRALQDRIKELIAECNGLFEKLEAERLATRIALESISSNAPRKEPSQGPTVGFRDDRSVDAEAANDAIAQAFNEGHTRAWWEASEMTDALIEKIEGATGGQP